MENWVEDLNNRNVFKLTKEFNGDIYTIVVTVENNQKSQRFWIAVSSGKKRKHRQIFEEKDVKSKGGITALLWVKEALLNFPSFYGNELNKKQYICICWSDSRRRNIYQRLQKEGFMFMIDGWQKVLIKKVDDSK